MATMTRDPEPAFAGDVNDDRTVTLGGTEDLTTVSTIEAHVALLADRTDRATLTAAVASAVDRTVTVSLGSWLAAVPTPGDWRITVQATFSDGTILTWGPDTLTVLSQDDA
jgi:hypothetical protein